MDKKPTVLILDDDQNLRKTLSDILEIKGFRPLPLGLGREALILAGREEIAVALIDLRLDDMPGLDVLRSLREISPSTECILLTGNASQASAIDAVNLGAYAYFQKPFDIEQLILFIRRAVEKRESTRALAESQALYHTFLNATTDMAFLKDENFRYVIVNEVNARYFGKRVDEVIGRDDFELMPSAAAHTCRASDQRALQENISIISVEEVDGRFYETRKFPVPLHAGQKGVGGYIRDITENLHAQQALLESEERYRTVADNTYDWEYWVGADGKWLYCSPACERITGYSVQQFLDDPDFLASMVYPDDLQKIAFHEHDAAATDLYETDFRIIHRDGSIRWIGHVCRAVIAPNGKKLGRRASNRDITEKKFAEINLKDAESKLRAIVEQVPAIVYTESAGRKRETLYISPQIELLTGYTPDEWIRDPDLWKKVIHPDDRNDVIAEDKRTTRSLRPFHSEYRIIARDGRLLWVRDAAVLVRGERDEPLFWQGIMHDITEQKQAQAALQESQRRLSTLMSNMPGLAYRCKNDRLWTMEFVSEGCYTLTGYQPEDLIENAHISYGDIIHPDDRQMVWDVIEAQLERKLPYQLNYRILTADRKEKWVWEQGQGVFGPSGELLALEGFITNITERKLAEESVRASEERYRMLADNMTDTIWLMDLGLKIIYISPSVTKLRGYTLEELNAIPLDQQMSPDSFIRAVNLFSTELTSDRLNKPDLQIARTVELEFYRKDGSSFWSENTFSLIRNLDGSPKAILGSGRDITERKQAQQALENSEKRFRALIENSSDVITLLDPRGKILYHSPSFRDVMGYEPQERVGKSSFELIHPEDQKATSQVLNEVVQHPGQTRSLIFRARHKDGSWRWVDATLSNMLGESAIQGIVANFRDVTARRQAEQELRASEEKFRSVIQQSVDGIVLVDEAGNIIEWNRGQEEITGLPASEALGKKIWDVQINLTTPARKTPENLAYLRSAVEQSLESGISPLFGHPVENAMQNPKTGKRFIQTLAFPISTEKGFMICSISRDVTEKKQSEETLRRQLTELEVLYENGLAISRLLEPREIASKMIEILSQKLDWHHAAIRLYHPESDSVEALAISHPGLSVEELQAQLDHLNSVITRPGRGLSGWVIKHGKAIRSGNVEADRRYLATYPNICSGLYVPILIGGRTIGSIAVESEKGDAFGEQDERILTTLASQAAIAFENARLYQEALRDAEQRAILHRAGQEVTGAGLDLKSVYKTIERAASGLMPFDAFVISRYDEERQEAEVVYAYDSGEYYSGYRFPLGEGINGWVIKERKPLLVHDYQKFKKLTSTAFGRGDARSILAVPMFSGAAIIGVISTQSYQTNVYSERDRTLLEILAAYAGPAIENARLFEQTLRRTEELVAVAAVSSALRSASMRDEMLPAILDQLTELLHVQNAGLIAYDPLTGSNTLEAARGKWHKLRGRRQEHGEGLSGWMAQTRLPYRSDQVLDEERKNYREEFPYSSAVLGVPLLVQKQFIGSIWVGRANSRSKEKMTSFTSDDMHLLNSIADIAANALHRATLHEQAVRHAEQLITVNEIGHVLGETLELNQIYTRLTGSIYNLIPDICGLFISIFDAKAGKITCACGHIDGAFIDTKTLPPLTFDPQGIGRQSYVLLHGEPLIANDLVQSPSKRSSKKFVGDPSKLAQSGLYVPMIVKGKPIGLIQLQSYTANRFKQEETNLLSLVANTAAIAIENARLFTETQKRLRNLSALHAIDTAISASVDLRVTLGILLEHTTSELKADAAAVLILNPLTHMLEYTASHGFFSHLVEGTRINLGEGLVGQAALQRRLQSVQNLKDVTSASRMESIYMGEGFVTQHAIPLVAKGQVQGVLEVFHRSEYQPDPEWYTFLEMLSGQAAIAIDSSHLFEELQRSNLDLVLAYDATIQGWSQALELRDKETEGHARRVTEMTVQLARRMGVPENEMEHVRRGTLLHDIGKMGIPDAILLKPGPLTPEEWTIMKRHPVYAYEMLSSIAYLRPALSIPHYHHEKWDGSGYPDGLKNEQIPLPARIFAIVDVYDALTAERPYREAWSKEHTLDYLRGQSGKHFDPDVVNVFLNMMNE